MLTLNDYLSKGSTYEKEVYNLLQNCIDSSKKETISLTGKDGTLFFDFFLEEGLSLLNWPKNTYVEVKYRMNPSIIHRLIDGVEKTKAKKLIVIFFEEIPPEVVKNFQIRINESKDVSKNSTIVFISFQELQNEIYKKNPQAKEQQKDDSSSDNSYKILKSICKNKRLSLFLGAGVSAAAGMPTWESLLADLCIKNKIPKIDSDIDSVVKGRFVIEEYKQYKKDIPEVFYDNMRNILYKGKRQAKLIESIARVIEELNVESIISYNYDDVLETTFNGDKKNTKKCVSIYDKTRTDDIPVYHVHGFIPEKGDHTDIILGEKEYHRIYQESYNWSNVEQLHALCRNTCLFIGLSMNDPNLRRLIDISIDGTAIEPIHYAFLRRIEYNVGLTEKILRGFGVNCIWYDNFEDLPNIFNDLVM